MVIANVDLARSVRRPAENYSPCAERQVRTAAQRQYPTAPLLLGTPGDGLSWTGLTDATGVAIPSADLDSTLFVVAQHGTPPLCGGQPGCTTTTAFPVKPFMDTYAPTAKAAWSGHQTFVLFGRPPVTRTENPADFLRLGIFSTAF